jgi:MFS transporter, DHA1 family, inner membrane transport protein
MSLSESVGQEKSFFPSLKSERAFLLLLAAMQFTHIVDFMILMPLGPRLMDTFAITPAVFGGLVSAYTFSAGVASILAAFVLDRVDRKKALLIAYFGFAFATLLCGLASNHHLLLMARILTGSFGGVVSSLILSLIPDAVPLTRRGAAMGTVMTSFSVASIAGVPIGLALSNHWGWQAPFFALALASTVMGLVSLTRMPGFPARARPQGQGTLQDFVHILSVPMHWRAFVFTWLMMGSTFLVIPYLSPTLVANGGVANEHLFLIYLCGGLVSFFTMPFFGKLGDRKGLFRVYMGLSLVAIIPVLLVTHIGPWGLAAAIPICMLFMSLISGRAAPGMALVSSVVEPRLRGGFMSLNTAMQQLASGTASLVAGWMITKSGDGRLLGYGLVGIVSCVGLLASIFLGKTLAVHRAQPIAKPNGP